MWTDADDFIAPPLQAVRPDMGDLFPSKPFRKSISHRDLTSVPEEILTDPGE